MGGASMIFAAVSIGALAATLLVVLVSQGRFKRRRATIVALTAAIAKLDVQSREPGRSTRVLAARAIAAGPNVFALDDYRRMRNARRPAAIPALFEASPRSLA
jgi:hypothetical protein